MKRRLSVAISLIGDPKVNLFYSMQLSMHDQRNRQYLYFFWRQIEQYVIYPIDQKVIYYLELACML